MIKIELINDSETVSDFSITITPKAQKKLKDTLHKDGQNNFLRIKIDNGGCSGLKYGFAIDNIKKEDDITKIVDGIEIVINSAVCKYIDGAIIDYIQELQGSYLKITNPNAKNSCSCGSSFSI